MTMLRGLYNQDGAMNVRSGTNYVTASASATTGLTISAGQVGDYLAGVLLIPSSVSPGAVAVKDGSVTISLFAGGASSVSNLVPFFVPLGANSVSGPWIMTTGSTITAVAVGTFS